MAIRTTITTFSNLPWRCLLPELCLLTLAAHCVSSVAPNAFATPPGKMEPQQTWHRKGRLIVDVMSWWCSIFAMDIGWLKKRHKKCCRLSENIQHDSSDKTCQHVSDGCKRTLVQTRTWNKLLGGNSKIPVSTGLKLNLSISFWMLSPENWAIWKKTHASLVSRCNEELNVLSNHLQFKCYRIY